MGSFLQILNDWVSNGQLTKIKDLFENTSALKDISKRTALANAYRVTNGNRSTLLLTACDKGNYDIVLYLVTSCGADVNLAGDVVINGNVIEGVPPLWLACHRNKLKIATVLLQAGAEVNARTKKTLSTPLRAACAVGSFDIVKLLVACDADVELANQNNNTCLMIACAKGHYEIVEYLLELNVSVNRNSSDGHTALHDSAENGDIRILKLLLSKGATPKPNNYGVTPILVAAMNEHEDIVKLFSKGLSKDKAADALELLGAKKVCSGYDRHKKKSDSQIRSKSLSASSRSLTSNVKNGIDCWYSACSLRNSVLSLYSKHLSNVKPRPVYNNMTEFKNAKELHRVQRDVTKVYFTALLISERLLGLEHPFTYNSIREVAVHFGKLRDFKCCFRLCLHAVDIHLLNLNPFCDEAFHFFKCCINLMFAFKLDDKQTLLDECRGIFIDLFNRIITQLDRMVLTKSSDLIADRRTTSGYFSLGLHVLSILIEDSNADQIFPLIEKLARIHLVQGIKVFLALSSSEATCEGIDVVDWDAVGGVSKPHLNDVAAKAYRLASQKSSTATSDVGVRFQYDSIQLLSQGNFGRAMVANRPADNARVVLKEISLSKMNTSERKSIVSEANALVNIKYSHPHMVQFFKVFEDGQKLVIEMEFCVGGDLAKLISKHKKEHGHFTEQTLKKWILQLASAIKFLHDNDIIHRNVKAKNVLVDSDLNVKLGQIGSSHKIDIYRQIVAKFKRKPSYVAPEVTDMQPYTKKADIWALGALAFEIATFRLPAENMEVNPEFVLLPISMPYSNEAKRFIEMLLHYRPNERPAIDNVLSDRFLCIV